MAVDSELADMINGPKQQWYSCYTIQYPLSFCNRSYGLVIWIHLKVLTWKRVKNKLCVITLTC